ncbi:hypothetical protein F5888DRAFT_1822651, partial [Russula emetica]
MEVRHLRANFWRPFSMLLSASNVLSTPRFLLTFADLGHYNLFDKGILHRDISSGKHFTLFRASLAPRIRQVMAPRLFLLPVSLSIDLFSRFECTRNVNYCRGFLIDGDHAIKWRELSSSQSITVCGTMPFMSIRLLSAWQGRQTVIHTALDDLESFLWVLM